MKNIHDYLDFSFVKGNIIGFFIWLFPSPSSLPFKQTCLRERSDTRESSFGSKSIIQSNHRPVFSVTMKKWARVFYYIAFCMCWYAGWRSFCHELLSFYWFSTLPSDLYLSRSYMHSTYHHWLHHRGIRHCHRESKCDLCSFCIFCDSLRIGFSRTNSISRPIM